MDSDGLLAEDDVGGLEDAPERVGHLARLDGPGGHRGEQRREEEVVPPVDHHQLEPGVVSESTVQLHRGVEAGKPPAHDDHPVGRRAVRRGPALVEPHVAEWAPHEVGQADPQQQHHRPEQRPGQPEHGKQDQAEDVQRGQGEQAGR